MNKIILDVEKLVLLMIDQNKSTKDLAQNLNIDHKTLISWFIGETNSMTITDLMHIAEYLNEDYIDLVLRP